MNLRKRICPIVVILLFAPTFRATASSLVVLKPETVSAWNDYVHTVRARAQERLHSMQPFLRIDEDQNAGDRVRDGEVLVSPVGKTPRAVPAGLIHDWVGTAFLPNVTLEQVLSTVRDYDSYKLFYGPTVLNSKTLVKGGSEDRFSMVLANKSLIAKTALGGDYTSSYVRVDSHHWYGILEATRIQEIEKYGTPAEHVLREDEGTGLIWRALTITRFEERDGGVYIEVEAIVLSRDVPRALRWAITPIVRRVSKDSLITSLRQTDRAVHSRDSGPVQASGALTNTVRSFR